MARAKKDETMSESTEIATAGEKTDAAVIYDPVTGEVLGDDMLADLEADQKDIQTFSADQMIIPRILLLQDLSPQVKTRDPEYIPGAQPGLICNGLTGSLDTEITFIPSLFTVRYMAWRPRPTGGLVDPDVDPSTLGRYDKVGVATWIGSMIPAGKTDPVNVEINETPEWAGIVVGADKRRIPAVISFVATKSKVARKMNTAVSMFEIETPEGSRRTPAYYQQFRIGSALEVIGENEFYTYTAVHEGLCKDKDLRLRARELCRQIKAGLVEIAPVSDGDQ